MKKETAEKINAIAWFAIAIILMWCAYSAWSKNGAYTMGSFCASLVFHGGPCFLGWMLVQEQIDKHYSNK